MCFGFIPFGFIDYVIIPFGFIHFGFMRYVVHWIWRHKRNGLVIYNFLVSLFSNQMVSLQLFIICFYTCIVDNSASEKK